MDCIQSTYNSSSGVRDEVYLWNSVLVLHVIFLIVGVKVAVEGLGDHCLHLGLDLLGLLRELKLLEVLLVAGLEVELSWLVVDHPKQINRVILTLGLSC
jgi:hypothetical protein